MHKTFHFYWLCNVHCSRPIYKWLSFIIIYQSIYLSMWLKSNMIAMNKNNQESTAEHKGSWVEPADDAPNNYDYDYIFFLDSSNVKHCPVNDSNAQAPEMENWKYWHATWWSTRTELSNVTSNWLSRRLTISKQYMCNNRQLAQWHWIVGTHFIS